MKNLLFAFVFCLGATTALTNDYNFSNNRSKIQQIKVYPNPTAQYVTFSFSEPIVGHIEIFNRYGVLKMSIKLQNDSETSLDLHTLKPDQYLYNIIVEGQSIATGIIMKL